MATIHAETLEISGGDLRVDIKGHRHPDEMRRNFMVLSIESAGMAVMEFRVFLTPDECGALAERLMSTKQAVEATGDEP